MRLYVDIEKKKLVQNLNSDRIASAPSFMQGDNEPIEIHLLAVGTSSLYEDKILNPKCDFLRVGIARFKGDPKLLSIQNTYTPLENGGCILKLPLNTLEIEKALGDNPSLDAFLEIEYSTIDGLIITVLQTPCKIKNDLIENAPNVEIQEQFLSKEQSEAVFLQKSDNLASVENKDEARQNLNAAPEGIFRDINRFAGFHGVYTTGSFYRDEYNSDDSVIGGNSYTEIHTFTILGTLLAQDAGMEIMCPYGSDTAYLSLFSPGRCIQYGYHYDKNWYSIYNEFNLSKPLEYGDRFAITFKDRVLRVYKNAELVGEEYVHEDTKFYNPYYILGYTGIKKDFVYSNTMVLPQFKSDGAKEWHKYSIEAWANNEPIPHSLFAATIKFFKTNYSTPLGSGYWLKCAAPKTFEGVYNTMVVYKEANTYGREFSIFSGDGTTRSGGVYLIKLRIYIPSSNTNGKKVYLKLGYNAITTSSVEILSRSNIDEKGYITALDAWTNVELKIRWKQSNGFGNVYVHLTNEAGSYSFMGTNDDTDERFYLASSSIVGLEGISAYYEGGLQHGMWIDKSGNGYDIPVQEGYGTMSFPPDSSNTLSKFLVVENFNWSTDAYAFFPSGFEIVQIVFYPNEEIEDTSNEEDYYNQNILRISDGYRCIVEELLPPMEAGVPHILTLKHGLDPYANMLYIDNIYNINFGGVLTFYFQKKPL